MSVKYISTVRLSPTTIRKTADLFQHKGRLQYQIGGKNGGQKQSSPTDDRKTVPEATVEGEVGAARPGGKNWRRLVRAGQSSRGGRAGAGAAKLGPRGLGRGVAALVEVPTWRPSPFAVEPDAALLMEDDELQWQRRRRMGERSSCTIFGSLDACDGEWE
jgi:hypothetical protein